MFLSKAFNDCIFATNNGKTKADGNRRYNNGHYACVCIGDRVERTEGTAPPHISYGSDNVYNLEMLCLPTSPPLPLQNTICLCAYMHIICMRVYHVRMYNYNVVYVDIVYLTTCLCDKVFHDMGTPGRVEMIKC